MNRTQYNTWHMAYTELFTVIIIHIVFPEQRNRGETKNFLKPFKRYFLPPINSIKTSKFFRPGFPQSEDKSLKSRPWRIIFEKKAWPSLLAEEDSDVLPKCSWQIWFPLPHLAQKSLLGLGTTSCYVFSSSPSKHGEHFANVG